MRYVLLIVGLGMVLSLHAQKRIYYNIAEEKVKSLDSAYRYSVEKKDTFRVYLRNGMLVDESYKIQLNGKKFTLSKAWYANGNLKYESYFKRHSRLFNMKYYWPNGKVKFEESGKNGKLDTALCKAYTQLGVDTTFYCADSLPQFPGGNIAESRLLNNNKIWKSDYKNDYLTVRFIVEKDGSVSNVKVLKGIDAELDQEAIRLISKLPKWKPATIGGDRVRTIIEYNFFTTVTSSEFCKDKGYRCGINKMEFISY
jgi:TonB family protein